MSAYYHAEAVAYAELACTATGKARAKYRARARWALRLSQVFSK